MSITAKELAKKLNLSEAAVSMALNGKPGVSTSTRQEILAAAEQYGYDFSRLLNRQLPGGSIYFGIYKKHGAVVGDTPFFSQLSEGIQNKCREVGYQLKIGYLFGDADMNRQIENILGSGCTGMILLGTEMHPEDASPFLSLKLPLVLLDVYFDSVRRDCILINNVQGAYLATDYLISRTKQQPGYLHSSYSISNFEERADGFYKAVRSHGMSSSKCIVHRLTPSVEGAYADMTELLACGEETAVCYFADNDFIAVGAMKAFLQNGRRVPEDISIIGFDNLPLGSYVEPPLTTIHVPKQYMGEVAASRLIDIISAKSFFPAKIEIGTNLIKRRSVMDTI